MKNFEEKNNIIQSTVAEVLHNSMMPYAEHVILDRALPRVEDGLKPVQRRILYAMYEMGFTPDKPHTKCAKIVGDCLGKYHPHGDSSVYDALVRMAQSFNMRVKLIDGHGNFGSVDGDGAAAYRYTEARLAPLALELLRDLEKDTVDFSNNFDDTLVEPVILPSKFPNLLVNGASGIAVGLATNIPTHNLVEVIDGVCAYIDNPKMTLEEMMQIIKGPDFPTGAIVIAGENNCELLSAYQTGRGKIKVRANVTLEKAGDRYNIVINELPYQVNKANLLKSIAVLKEKKIAPFDDIYDIVDESDRNGMRAVIKVKSSGNPEKVLTRLYEKTELESTFGINMVAIADGKPRQLGLLEIVDYYVNYQVKVLLRRTKYDLEQAKQRAHIVEGLIIAVTNIDEVIKIIRASASTAEAKQNLCERFLLSEEQAQAVLDLRLSRLTKLEVEKLEKELAELKAKIEEYEKILVSKKKQFQIIKDEMTVIKKKFGEKRKTAIEQTFATVSFEEEAEDKKVEDFVIMYSADNTFKKIKDRGYKQSDTKITDKTERICIAKHLIKMSNDQTLFAFTNAGNCCKINIDNINENRFGEKGRLFREVACEVGTNEQPVAFFAVKENALPDNHLYFFTKSGMIKKSHWSEYSLHKPYYEAINVKDDEVIAVLEDLPDTNIAFVTESGQCLVAKKEGINALGRKASGVKGLNLTQGDKIVSVMLVDDENEIVLASKQGCYKKVLAVKMPLQDRNRKGVKIFQIDNANDGVLFARCTKEGFNMIVFDDSGNRFTVSTDDLAIEDRTTGGKKLRNEHRRKIPTEILVDLQSENDE